MLRICCTPAAGNALICNLGAARDRHRLRLPLAFSALASSAATRAASASAALRTHRPSEPLDALLSGGTYSRLLSSSAAARIASASAASSSAKRLRHIWA